MQYLFQSFCISFSYQVSKSLTAQKTGPNCLMQCFPHTALPEFHDFVHSSTVLFLSFHQELIGTRACFVLSNNIRHQTKKTALYIPGEITTFCRIEQYLPQRYHQKCCSSVIFSYFYFGFIPLSSHFSTQSSISSILYLKLKRNQSCS